MKHETYTFFQKHLLAKISWKKNMACFIFFHLDSKTAKNCKTNLLVATIDYILPFLMNGIAFGLFMDAVVREWFDQDFGFLIVWAFFAFLQVCCGGGGEGGAVLVVDLVLDCVALLLLFLVCFVFYWSFTWGVASLVSLEVEVGNVSSGCVIFRSLSSKVPWSDITIGDWFLSIKRPSFSKI